ncbi:MAG: GNAT family N-acetyltransferase [Propionibacteriales bacterium]|nr:GNAT family N-acetyltransferase [Propionibacteriales bacterium]
MTDPATLLAAYDEQLRGNAEGSGVASTVVGPLVRVEYARRGFVSYRTLDGIDSDRLDALIAGERDYFAAKGQRVEWKTRGHDRPADLPDRLLAAGFVPEDVETVVIAESARVASMPALPEGVTIRRVSDRPDLERIAALESEVWGEDWSWLTDDLVTRVAESADDIQIFVAEADGVVVSAAWTVFKPGTDFAGLWGGSTLQQWRGRGLYKALVATRAQQAVEHGFRYLQVDASDDSRPILERLGFVAVTTTTPYIFTPPTR